MSQRYWLIEGFDSNEKIYSRNVKYGYFSEGQLRALLKTLTAKASLSYDEILGAYAKKRTKIANEHLIVKKSGIDQSYTCGSNPHFMARIVLLNDVWRRIV